MLGIDSKVTDNKLYKSVFCPENEYCVQLWSLYLKKKKGYIRNGKGPEKDNKDDQSYELNCPQGVVEPEKKDNVEQK